MDPRLDRVILQALQADPKARPQSAAAIAASLADAAFEEAGSRKWLYGGVAVAVAMVIAAVIAAVLVPRAGARLTAQDTIVLADFTNSTSDPVFDGALKVALAVALEQSPFLKVFPDDRMRETLRLMGKAPDAAITRSVKSAGYGLVNRRRRIPSTAPTARSRSAKSCVPS